jgi:hypothetical protein
MPAETGADQIRDLAADPTSAHAKVVAVDSHYAQPSFLRAFVGLAPQVVTLARLASNRVLSGPPPPPTGKPGRPGVHGAKLALRAPGPPERQETVRLVGQRVPSGCRLSAWSNQHFKALPALVGLVLRVEFLQADGTRRYKRPLWLFWSGPSDVGLADLAQMDLLRFVIEHFFRFLKQRLGLLAPHHHANAITSFQPGIGRSKPLLECSESPRPGLYHHRQPRGCRLRALNSSQYTAEARRQSSRPHRYRIQVSGGVTMRAKQGGVWPQGKTKSALL